ncbi:flagellar basal body-associated protein FliL [Acidocella sp.]|uniref:flagellar basal body-associated FliL family protein n=1 Tax=Acidocella sp. TaxID=50710 RepID=UPI00260F2AAB|nr:flagellar basal body-associated FliL family protein [Acidocella sp.]
MKKSIIAMIAGGVVLVVGAGGGAAYMLLHKAPAATHAAVAPKPLYFADMSGLVVSVPSDVNSGDQVYIQISVQFSTYDQNAATAFDSVSPIIKSQIIQFLMAKTAKDIMAPANQPAMSGAFLKIVNDAMSKAGPYSGTSPFSAAYITNLVEQN